MKGHKNDPRRLRALAPLLILFCMLFGTPALAAVTGVSAAAAAADGSFVKRDGKWAYVYEDGSCATDCLLTINGKTYYFSEDGYRLSGWQTIGDDRYYFGTADQGYMYKSRWLVTKSNTYYRFKKNGKAVGGWLTLNGKKYYFSPSTNKRYYGLKTIGGKKYYFGTKKQGYMYRSQWVTYKNKLYYFRSNGTPPQGWKTIGDNEYYFTKAGYAWTGTHTIGGIKCYFNKKGVLLYKGPKLSVSSDCAILVNADTGETLYAKSAETKHAIASTTKIMTCILALEKCSLNEKVTASAYAASQEETKLYLHADEVFYLKDLLYSLMLPSHNDSAVAIAEHISGSTAKFAKLMNRKAKSIGCTSTNFVTPNGLDNYTLADGAIQYLNHYSTAHDLARIASYAYQNQTFRTIIATKSYSFTSLSGYSYSFQTTNTLLGQLAGVTGMKTGYTDKAGQCFVGSIEAPDGSAYICVVLGGSSSSARWTDARTLLQYAYRQG